jgi:hypothetical protein
MKNRDRVFKELKEKLKQIKIHKSFRVAIKIHEKHVKDKARIEKLIKDPKDIKLSSFSK